MRNEKGQNRKGKIGTNRGSSSVKQGGSSAQAQGTSRNTSALVEHQKLLKVGNGIIVTLMAIAQKTLTMGDGSAIFSSNFASVEGLLCCLTQGLINPLSLLNPDLPWKTLGLMAQACHESELQNSFVHLTYWVNIMQFASQVLR